MDPSGLRKPYAKEMPALMRVRKTGSEKGMVQGIARCQPESTCSRLPNLNRDREVL